MSFVMHLDCTLWKIEVQCQHFFYRLNMIVTEFFLILYDLSWFSSLKNSHILFLVQIIVYIDDVIKTFDIIKKKFCWIFWVVLYIVELFYVFRR